MNKLTKIPLAIGAGILLGLALFTIGLYEGIYQTLRDEDDKGTT